jgi:protein transport protein SEC24
MLHESDYDKVPPSMRVQFVVKDKGIASPRFIRSSLNTISFKSEILEETKIPFGILIQPFADLVEGD